MYIPIHLQPYYRKKYGYRKGDFPFAENYFERALILPIFPLMTDAMVDRVIDTVKGYYG